MTFQVGDKVRVRKEYQTPELRVGNLYTVRTYFEAGGDCYVIIAELNTTYLAHRFELVRREVFTPTTCTTSRIQQMYNLNKKRKQLCASL